MPPVGSITFLSHCNGLYHLITPHSNDGIVPEIPGELLVKIFIHKQEENALGKWKITSLIVLD